MRIHKNDGGGFKPYMGLREAAAYTGLSYCYLRKGCISGEIPHRRNGRRYFVDVGALVNGAGGEHEQQNANR